LALFLHLLADDPRVHTLRNAAPFSGSMVLEESDMPSKKQWVRNVKTVSTYPPKDLFTRDARTIANTLAQKEISPKGIGSGIRMIQFFINRAGKNLSAERRSVLEKAKKILQEKSKKHQR